MKTFCCDNKQSVLFSCWRSWRHIHKQSLNAQKVPRAEKINWVKCCVRHRGRKGSHRKRRRQSFCRKTRGDNCESSLYRRWIIHHRHLLECFTRRIASHSHQSLATLFDIATWQSFTIFPLIKLITERIQLTSTSRWFIDELDLKNRLKRFFKSDWWRPDNSRLII